MHPHGVSHKLANALNKIHRHFDVTRHTNLESADRSIDEHIHLQMGFLAVFGPVISNEWSLVILACLNSLFS